MQQLRTQAASKAQAALDYTRTIEAALAAAMEKLEERDRVPTSSSSSMPADAAAAAGSGSRAGSLAAVAEELRSLQVAHAELSSRHFALGHKYRMLKSSYLALPDLSSQVATMRERLHEAERALASYREQVEAPGGMREGMKEHIASLSSQLARTSQELRQAREQLDQAHNHASAQADDRLAQANTSISELQRLLELQKSMAASKQSKFNDTTPCSLSFSCARMCVCVFFSVFSSSRVLSFCV